ncbi:hypothetical protein RND71_026195 [Anisodus tanguticus]|uniref:Protein yippee-like n=1 Tax=Anisodus tanguticus TaxID=243964 RepID=A0AAE1RLW0_9SOLA|nr:hypothetical protein RND71_026195 [Anisodus tanguticus]
MEGVVGPRIYSCCKCRNHIALHDDIVSKKFQVGKQWESLFIYACHECSDRAKGGLAPNDWFAYFADVKCSDYGEVLGWNYERAYDESQKYKEGKFVLERFKIVMKENW